jgi:hypothetical protein
MADAPVLPHNLEAERAVLGAVLVDNDVFDRAGAVIRDGTFYRVAHAKCWTALAALHGRGEPLDLIALRAELERRGDLEDVGGPAYIAGLIDGVPKSTNVEHYARLVQDTAARRMLAEIGRTLAAEACSGVDAPGDLIDQVEAKIADTRARLVCGIGRGAGTVPVIVNLAEVRAEAVSWLWQGRLAAGKLTLFVGDPGVGKSWITCDLAARSSAGRAWPDGAPSIGPIDVLMLSAEDGLADTIRPRLDALGADVSRVHHLAVLRNGEAERAVRLTDIDAIETAIDQTSAQLVTIDPLTAYAGTTDTHRDADVRGMLAPVAALAERKGVALACVMHLAKATQRPALYRTAGSIAFTAAARIVLAVAADPTEPERRIVAPVKSNLSAPPAALAYRLTDGRLSWDAGPVVIDVEALLAGPASSRDREDTTDAEALIAALLTDVSAWPMAAKDAQAAADAHGIPERTLRRTARQMGIRVARLGFGPSGKWMWYRPAATAATTLASDENLASIAGMAGTDAIEAIPAIEATNSVQAPVNRNGGPARVEY